MTALAELPFVVFTVIGPEVAPFGTVAFSCPAVTPLNEAAVPLNCTLVTPRRLAPVTVTVSQLLLTRARTRLLWVEQQNYCWSAPNPAGALKSICEVWAPAGTETPHSTIAKNGHRARVHCPKLHAGCSEKVRSGDNDVRSRPTCSRSNPVIIGGT